MHPIFRRLRERKLVQWALAYLAGAFALFTGLQALGEPWGVTSGFLRGVQAVLVVGFFITITLAWYHGEQGRQRVSGPELLIIAGLLIVGTLASLDRPDEAEAALDSALREEPSNWDVGAVAAALSRLEGTEAALNYLERTAASSPRSLDFVDCYAEVRELKGNERYRALMDGLGFPGRGS